MHLWREPDGATIAMPPKQPGYQYMGGRVRLMFRPGEGMTWGMWGNVLRGIRLFGEGWQFVGLRFYVVRRLFELSFLPGDSSF